MEALQDLRYAPHVGLALGGGGALGAAHVGVLQVLHERAIEPSIIVGTSVGSVIGGAAALGMDPYDLERRVLDVRPRDIGSVPTRPGLGLLTADALRDTIRAVGGDVLIEDLPRRYGAVATDMDSRTVILIDHGPLADAMAASIAVPGVFQPVRMNGARLVDGGVLQNLPIEATFEMGARHVIGVRLAPEWDSVPSLSSSAKVHQFEIRRDVTLISPVVGSRTQWVPKDLPGLVLAGRRAAERMLAEYPPVHAPPSPDPSDEG